MDNEKLEKIIKMGELIGGTPQVDQMLLGAFMDQLFYTPPSKTDDLASAFQLTGDPYIGKGLNESLYGELGINPGQMDTQNQLLEQLQADFPVTGTGEGVQNAEFIGEARSNPNIASDYYKDVTADKENNNFLQNWFNSPNSQKNRQARMQEILARYAQET